MQDSQLAETLSELHSEYDIFLVQTESELADAILSKHPGVAVIDADGASSEPGHLIDSLRSQFPDLVLIVAGGPQRQAALGPQITSGAAYRFLHKPVSELRVRLFIDAAWRRHDEGQLGGAADLRNPDASPTKTRPTTGSMVIGGIALVALAGLGGWLALRELNDSAAGSAAGTRLFQLPTKPRHDETEKTLDKLLTAAESELQARNFDEARRLTDQARALKPDYARVTFLTTEIDKARERWLATQPRQASMLAKLKSPSRFDPAASQPQTVEGRTKVAMSDELAKTAADDVTLQKPLPAQTPSTLPASVSSQTTLEQRESQTAVDASKPTTDAGKPAAADQPRVTDRAAATQPWPSAAPSPAVSTATAQPNIADKPSPSAQQPAASVQQPTDSLAGYVSAGSLQLAHYVPPRFPDSAREKAISGWVELSFVVKTDGSVSDIMVTRSQPVGVFEQAAVDALRKWHYRPVQRDGRAVEQPARIRVKFAMEN